MLSISLNWVPYQEGDEDIVIGEDNTAGIEEVYQTQGCTCIHHFPILQTVMLFELLFGQKTTNKYRTF